MYNIGRAVPEQAYKNICKRGSNYICLQKVQKRQNLKKKIHVITVVTKCNPAQRKLSKVKKTFMKRKFSSQENFYWEKKEKVFFPRKLLFFPKRTFSSSFVIDATDRQLIRTTKFNYILDFFSFLTFKTFYFYPNLT